MAIDTKAKRMNMLAVASPFAWSYHFEVDGAVDADDRAHLLHLYGGNAFDAPTSQINSKGKRFCMLAFASPLAWQLHPDPDGGFDAGDRAHLLHLYCGNALGAPVDDAVVDDYILRARRRGRR